MPPRLTQGVNPAVLLAECCDRNVTRNLRPQHYVKVKGRIGSFGSSGAKARDDRIKFWPVTVVGWFYRAADMDEAGDALMRRDAKRIENSPIVSVPLRNSARGIAHGVRGKDETHRGGAGGELLLPFGDLHMRTGAADNRDNKRST